ncbi:MAG: oligosaccharide flippase family protein, partial [Myxococcota bacterium]|nr:oligosaccharide flippase family protein [Myxococcota bacterium]
MSAQSQSEQAGVLVIGRVLASLSEALVLLLIVRLLGKADLGVLAALVLVYETLALILSAGFPASLMYYLPSETPEVRGALARRFTGVLIGLGGLAAVALAGVGAVDLLQPGYWAQLAGGAVGLREDVGQGVSLQYLVLLAPGAILELPSRMLPNLLVVEGRARAAAGVGVVRSLGRTLFTVVPIALGLDLWWVAGSMTVFGLLYGSLVFWFLRDLYGDLPRVPSPHTVRDLFRFAIPLGFTDTVGILNKRLDRYLIVALFAATAVAEYEVGAWQIPFVASIPF